MRRRRASEYEHRWTSPSLLPWFSTTRQPKRILGRSSRTGALEKAETQCMSPLQFRHARECGHSRTLPALSLLFAASQQPQHFMRRPSQAVVPAKAETQ